MLKWIENIDELSFYDLMLIYSESNQRDCALQYPDHSVSEALFSVESTFYHYLNDIFFKISGAKYAVWISNDVWISALRIEPFVDGFLLSGLETHPDFRNQGYAQNMIAEVISTFPSKTKIYSHILATNNASIATHVACGFHKILPYSNMLDGSFDANIHTYLLCCP